jgi:hypothetical protein
MMQRSHRDLNPRLVAQYLEQLRYRMLETLSGMPDCCMGENRRNSEKVLCHFVYRHLNEIAGD